MLQMMKGFTPGLTLILAGLLGKERFAFRLAAAVLAVCAGTAAAALLERRAAAHFSAQGMFWMMFSSLSECLRVVMIQTVGEAHTVTPTSEPSAQHAGKPESSSRDVHCSQEPVVSSVGTQATQSPRLAIRKAGAEPMSLDLAETLMYVSGPASIILAVLSSIIERQGIVDALFGSSSFSEAHREGASGAAVAGAGSVVQTVLLLAAVAVASLLTNLAGYSAVQVQRSIVRASLCVFVCSRQEGVSMDLPAVYIANYSLQCRWTQHVVIFCTALHNCDCPSIKHFSLHSEYSTLRALF